MTTDNHTCKPADNAQKGVKKARFEESRAKVRPGKHGNLKHEYNGLVFDSGRELARWKKLELMQHAGLITGLERQVKFQLVERVWIASKGRWKPAVRYIADAVYFEDGKKVVEDAKSPHLRKDPYYRLKMHLMIDRYGIEVREV